MKKLKFLTLALLLLSVPVWSDQEDCPPDQTEPAPELVKNMREITESLYKDVLSFKVSLDGEGKVSVFFEKGVPKIIRLTYKNGKGEVSETLTFDQISRGGELSYSNPEKPGTAIAFSKGEKFQQGSHYAFKLKVRTSTDPQSYKTYDLNFDSTYDSPKIKHADKEVKKMVLSPGIKRFSWDGTFKNVEFR
jgi:hypothetical protein